MNRIDQELIEAVAENNVPEVSRLLRAGADIEAKSYLGMTPLHVTWLQPWPRASCQGVAGAWS
jgi:hypothetical protein